MDEPVWIGRWRAVLPGHRDAVQRVHQGRAFQRSGRVASLRIEPGRLSGRVQGSRPTPYQVEVLLGVLDAEQWRTVVQVVAGQVRYAAGLLAGQVPDALVEALEDAGIDLFGSFADVDARCACGEASRPCAHVVALWLQAAERFADDPFGLFALRGRGRQRLLAELLAARRHGSEDSVEVQVGTLAVEGWCRAREPLDGVVAPATEAVADPLRMLGDPPGWAGVNSAEDLFRPLVERAARHARALRD